MKHLRKIQVSDGNYELLSQQELLRKLSDIGISITAQTLRNWEQRGLISPAARIGLKKRRGLRVIYTEINIAEAFAVWCLTHPINVDESLLPRYSLRQIEIARYMFLKLKVPITYETIVLEDYYKIQNYDKEAEELIKELPHIKVSEDSKWHFDIKIDDEIDNIRRKLFIIDLLTAYSSFFFEGLFIVNDWEACVGT